MPPCHCWLSSVAPLVPSAVLSCAGYLVLLQTGLRETIAITDFSLSGGEGTDYLIISFES